MEQDVEIKLAEDGSGKDQKHKDSGLSAIRRLSNFTDSSVQFAD